MSGRGKIKCLFGVGDLRGKETNNASLKKDMLCRDYEFAEDIRINELSW